MWTNIVHIACCNIKLSVHLLFWLKVRVLESPTQWSSLKNLYIWCTCMHGMSSLNLYKRMYRHAYQISNIHCHNNYSNWLNFKDDFSFYIQTYHKLMAIWGVIYFVTSSLQLHSLPTNYAQKCAAKPQQTVKSWDMIQYARIVQVTVLLSSLFCLTALLEYLVF